METNTNNPHDYNNMRYVGWEQTGDNTLTKIYLTKYHQHYFK